MLLSAGSALAQSDEPLRTIDIEQVVVEAARPLSGIGVQKTALDSVVLRENVTNSLADLLSQNSTLFIKSYGRGTLSTASFRGTAPSHTRVTWNGMTINSPMLGMVDFSMIPSYFIDEASLYHGASSLG
ncbi:MAG: Plug domain-containing protein, partial [Rikenellaceae bacterium]|nr:Plug domain-containing protein [Rikenellaceae bacterium]